MAAEAKRLHKTILGRGHLRSLAGSPLLLTLMAQLHSRDGQLPEDRADLYDRAVKLLLAQWETRIERDLQGRLQQSPGILPQLGLEVEDVRRALARVAFVVHERQEQSAGRGEGAAAVPEGDLLAAFYVEGIDLGRAKELIEYVVDRAGLLIHQGERVYAFPHRTFQEYLAAEHVCRSRDFQRNYPEQLSGRVWRDVSWWREVYLLGCGSLKEVPWKVAWLVLALLPERQGSPGGEEVEVVRLGAQALIETDFRAAVEAEESQAPGPRPLRFVYGEVQGRLLEAMRSDGSVSAVERAGAGDSLAELGDPRREVMEVEAMEFCYVAAGRFWMGSSSEDEDAEDEKARHALEIPYEYWMGRYPVTVRQYEGFVKSGGYEERRYWTEAGWAWRDQEGVVDRERYGGGYELSSHPVVGVSWYEAVAYCRWLTERLRKAAAVRLLGCGLTQGEHGLWEGLGGGSLEVVLASESEWEKGARGEAGARSYPWGEEADSNRANYEATGIGWTSAVGCFPGGASPYGLEELSGNVWEWTRSKYKGYPYSSKDGREEWAGDSLRVLRGGSCVDGDYYVRCAARVRGVPGDRLNGGGFRVILRPTL